MARVQMIMGDLQDKIKTRIERRPMINEKVGAMTTKKIRSMMLTCEALSINHTHLHNAFLAGYSRELYKVLEREFIRRTYRVTY